MMLQIIKETGWTWHYVLWKVSWLNIQMMVADSPRLSKKKKKAKEGNVSDLRAKIKAKYG